MTFMLDKTVKENRKTSAGEKIKPYVVSYSIAFSGTNAGRNIVEENFFSIATTGTGSYIEPTCNPDTTQKSLNQLRKLSGLTWDQLAKLFNVTRRSLHSWASGQPLNSFNEEQLNRLLGTIQYIDRGSANLNRSLLMEPDSNGNPRFELLVAGKHDEFKNIVGRGNTPKRPQLKTLSKDAHTARMPQNPEALVGALQDPIHRDIERCRPARATRGQKNNSGQ